MVGTVPTTVTLGWNRDTTGSSHGLNVMFLEKFFVGRSYQTLKVDSLMCLKIRMFRKSKMTKTISVRQTNTIAGSGGNSNIFGNFQPDPWGFMIHFDDHIIFQMGWFNHQLDCYLLYYLLLHVSSLDPWKG